MNISHMIRTKNTLVMYKVTNYGSAVTPGDCIVFYTCLYVLKFRF